MVKDLTYTFGIKQSKLMLVYFQSAPVINLPYFFQADNEITNKIVTGISLVDAGLLSDGNVAGTYNNYNFIPNTDMRSVCVYLGDSSGNISLDQQPIMTFDQSFIGGTTNFGKKYRTRLKIDPSTSYVIFKVLPAFTTYPAVIALNLTLTEK
jgi:hypothetical protein